MRNDDWIRMAEKLGDLFGRPMRSGTVGAWYEALQSHDMFDVRDALGSLARTEDRMPSLARLLAEVWKIKRTRLAVMPTLAYDPNVLPEGVVAIVRSSNYQETAVTNDGWGSDGWPADIKVTEVIGDQRVLSQVPS